MIITKSFTPLIGIRGQSPHLHEIIQYLTSFSVIFSNYTHNFQYFNFAEQLHFIWNISSKIHLVRVYVYPMVPLISILPWVRKSSVVRKGGLRP